MNRQPELDEDESAKEWERIKDFVGARNKPAKHPLIQEAERQRAKEPQHFDEGGDVQPAIPEIVPDNTPPTAPPATTQPPMDAGSGAATTAAMGGVTPEMLKALADKLNTQNKWGQVGAGIAGIGDAIQSVGGINGGHMKAAEDLIQRNRENQLKTPEMMMAAGKEKYGLGKEIENDDPTSMRSFTAQQANKSFLLGLDFKPEEIGKIPASMIDGLRSGALQRDEVRERIKSDKAIKEMGFGLQGKQIDATIDNQSEARRLQASKDQQDAAKAVAGRSVIQRGVDKVFGNPAVDVLNKQAQGNGGSVPDGRVTVVSPDGKIGHIPQEQLKAAIAKGYKVQ